MLSSYAAGATEVPYTTSFPTRDGLTANYSTIVLAAPAETIFNSNPTTACIITDDSTGVSSSCVSIVISGTTAMLTTRVSASSGDQITAIVQGVSKPTAAGTYRIRLSTSSDPVMRKVGSTLV